MPQAKDYSFRLTVKLQGRYLPEYQAKNGRYYIESDIVTNDSYKILTNERGCEDVQTLTVTPYVIHIEVNKNVETSFYEVWVDGTKICCPLLTEDSEIYVRDVRSGDTFKELVFAVPPEGSAKLNVAKASLLGVITVYRRAAHYVENRTIYSYSKRVTLKRSEDEKPLTLDRNDTLIGGTKKDCTASGDGMIMTTVSGRPLQKMESRNNNPLKSYKPWFDKGDIIVDAEITYRPLATLQMMKLVEYYPQPPLAEKKEEDVEMTCDSTTNSDLNPDVTKTFDDISDHQPVPSTPANKPMPVKTTLSTQKMSMYHSCSTTMYSNDLIDRGDSCPAKSEESPERTTKRRISPITPVPGKKLIPIGDDEDDMYILESDNSDVECLGDEECQVLDVPSPEIPTVDLLNESSMVISPNTSFNL